MKSSAASISLLLPSALFGREATPTWPSGLPVVKKKGSAYAGSPSTSINANVENTPVINRIAVLPSNTRNEKVYIGLRRAGGDTAPRYLNKAISNVKQKVRTGRKKFS